MRKDSNLRSEITLDLQSNSFDRSETHPFGDPYGN
jgi:hypothetical protein